LKGYILDRVYISSGAFKTKKIDKIFKICEKLNIKNIELSANIEHDENIEDKIYKKIKNFNFLLHNYFPAPKEPFLLNFASSNEEIIQKSFNLAKKAIDISSIVGAEFYAVHCGFTFDSDGSHLGNSSQMNLKRISLDKAYNNFIKNIKILNNYAKRKNVKLAIENNVIADFGLIDGENKICLGADTEGLERIFDSINDDNLYLLLDLGHAKVNVNTVNLSIDKLIETFYEKIIGLHISDNNGKRDTNSKIGKNSDLVQYIMMLRDRYLIIEVYNLEEKEILEQIKIVKDIADDK
jgi:sugar phosphate isomerase/epimerase